MCSGVNEAWAMQTFSPGWNSADLKDTLSHSVEEEDTVNL